MPIQITSHYVIRKPEILDGEPTIVGTNLIQNNLLLLLPLADVS